MENARFVVVVATLALWTLALAPFQWLFLRGPVLRRWPAGARALPHLYHRGVARVMGLRIEVVGRPTADRPLLVVANHISWLDIVVLSAAMPVSFVAKAEMVTWPLFGWLARAQRTVFVNRAERRGAGEQADRISRRLEASDAMVLFPEGTTSDGTRVLRFNASLFGAATNVLRRGRVAAVHVQPVSIHFTASQGVALGRVGMRRVGWPGTVGLFPHFTDTLRDGALDVRVTFCEPVRFDPATKRKRVSALARGEIREARSVDLDPHRL